MGLLQFFFQEGAANADTVSTAKLTFLDLAMKGGLVMAIIVLLSLVAAYIFIERFVVI